MLVKRKPVLFFLVSLVLTIGCKTPQKDEVKSNSIDVKAQAIVDKAIEAHGGDLFVQSKVAFTFRDKRHSVVQDDKSYLYQRSFEEDGKTIRDVYENNVFTRFIDDAPSKIGGRTLDRSIEDVNAVSYFALLPYKLNDAAVIKEFAGVVNVNGKPYEKVKVTFQQEGGGHSPDNVFYYWFDQSTGFLEFLAYTKGGNRFRSAFNHRTVNGIHFVDYINYNGGDYSSEDIASYDKLFEEGKLKELSRIILEDVEVMPK